MLNQINDHIYIICICLCLAPSICASETIGMSSSMRTQEYYQTRLAKLRESERNPLVSEMISLKNKNKLDIVIKSQPRCTFGDLDIMALDTDSRKSRNLLLSVEPLDSKGEGFKSVSKSIWQGEQWNLEEGEAFDLPIPLVKKPSIAGIFICSDNERSGKCIDKRIEDLREIFSRHEVPVNFGELSKAEQKQIVDTRYRPSADNVYYFQMVIIDKNSIYFPVKGTTALKNTELRDYVKQYLHEIDKENSGLEWIERASSTLGNRRLENQDDTLVIDLPRLVREKCGW